MNGDIAGERWRGNTKWPAPWLNNQLLTMKNSRGKIRVVAMGAGYFFLTNRRAIARDDGWVNQGSN
jgi:hypothetical protein